LLQVLNVEQVSRIDVKLTAEGQDMLNSTKLYQLMEFYTQNLWY